MRFITLFTGMVVFGVACTPAKEKQPQELTGTWQLFSATATVKDSTYSTFNPKDKMIKIINPSHFAFFNHDLNQGRDSIAAFASGGGRYTLLDSLYEEHLEYCNFREWEGHRFTFVIKIANDTLTQRGIEKIENLGIDRIITERYVRVAPAGLK